MKIFPASGPRGTGSRSTGAIDRRSFLRAGAVTIGAAGAGSVLAACSSNGSPSVTTSNGKSLASINIINTDTTDTLAFQQILQDKGWLEAYGVKASTTNVADGVKATAAITSGSADIALMSGFGQIFPLIAKGESLKLIGGTGQLANFEVWSAQPGISTLADLKGKTVGIGAVGALLDQVMLAMFHQEGIDSSSVTFVDIGSSADVFKAVVARRIDAGLGSIGFAADEQKYGVHSVANVWTVLPDWVNQGSFTSASTIKSKREGLIGTLAAYAHLFSYLQGPGSESDYVNAYVKVGGSAPTAKTLWNWYQQAHPFDTGITLSPTLVTYMQQMNILVKSQTSVLPYATVTDMSLAQAAVKLAATVPTS